MNLSIGAALALLLVGISEAFEGRRVTPSEAMDFLASPEGNGLWLWSGVAILGAASIFVSLSRGGIIAMLLSLAFTTVVLTTRRSLRGRGQLMALIAVAAFACVLYIGFDAVYERLASLAELDKAQGGSLADPPGYRPGLDAVPLAGDRTGDPRHGLSHV